MNLFHCSKHERIGNKKKPENSKRIMATAGCSMQQLGTWSAAQASQEGCSLLRRPGLPVHSRLLVC